jgi:hypothetical protein
VSGLIQPDSPSHRGTPRRLLEGHPCRTDGRWGLEGRRLTGFTNEEETKTGFAGRAPWLLEDRLRAAGSKFDAGC